MFCMFQLLLDICVVFFFKNFYSHTTVCAVPGRIWDQHRFWMRNHFLLGSSGGYRTMDLGDKGENAKAGSIRRINTSCPVT